jgi:hypothetical protein
VSANDKAYGLTAKRAASAHQRSMALDTRSTSRWKI